MSLFCFPSAASSTIRARCTSLTLVSFERTSLVSSPRSSSVNTISVATRTIAPNYLAVVLMTLPNPDKFHQEQNTTLASTLGNHKRHRSMLMHGEPLATHAPMTHCRAHLISLVTLTHAVHTKRKGDVAVGDNIDDIHLEVNRPRHRIEPLLPVLPMPLNARV